MRFFNDKLLSALRVDSEVFKQLEAAIVVSGAREDLDEQARNIGKAQGLKTEVISLSKVIIHGLRHLTADRGANYKNAMLGAWKELLEIRIARDKREEFIADAGQELAEALICETAAEFIFLGNNEEYVCPGDYNIETRFWLAGLLDSITEMSKLVNHRLRDLKKDKAAREEVRARYLEFAESAYNILAGFSGVPSTTIDASRRRGQGFQSKLARVGNHLELKANESVLLEDMALVAGGAK